ncbi:MAG: ThuA domain-containing protein [Actinomycetota bacterium]|nr:ThuA domain-containing protein [Actinomycetota bacterium]
MLVTGGKYHDFDFARRELLGLLAEHDEFRVRVQPDYEDAEAIAAAEILVSYTCDVRPSERAQRIIRDWVEGGGRWVALHGTNSALGDASVRPMTTPRPFRLWADTLGSQFIAHPPIEPYTVEITEPSHWLVADIDPFEATDELYLNEYPDRASLVPLLHTMFHGTARGFEESDWTAGDPQHLVMYLRPLGEGGVLYNTLGHCRGHYDMVPISAYYPNIDRCSWELPVFYELLRRSLRWARGQTE